MNRLFHRLKLQHRFAGLSLLGMLMVAVPLVPLLHHQGLEIGAALAEQAGLDPVARALDVQRSLLVHRDLAHRVLSGHDDAEAQRRVRAAEVDTRVAELGSTLTVVRLQRAIDESQALHQDWSLLAARVHSRSLRPDESWRAHRLLVEQALQVIDLVADLSSLRSNHSELIHVAATSLHHSLPRLVNQIAALDDPARTDHALVAEGELAALQTSLALSLGRINRALAHDASPPADLAAATAIAGVTAERLLGLHRDRAGVAPADLQSASIAAREAQFELAEAARRTLARSLGERVLHSQGQRAQTLALLLALALLAAALGRHLYVQISFAQLAHGGPAAAADPIMSASAGAALACAPPPSPAQAASELLRSLRQGDAAPSEVRRREHEA